MPSFQLSSVAKRLAIAALVLFTVALSVDAAHATHFRYGTISWEIPDPNQPNVVSFRLETAWRRSFPWPSPSTTPQLGQTVNTGYQIVIPGQPSLPLTFVVSAVHPAEDWMVGVTEFTRTLPSTPGIHRVGFADCCRISTLENGNRDREFRLFTDVVIDPANPILRSPRATSVPVITLARGQLANIWVPSVAGTDGPSTFNIAPTGTGATGSGLAQAVPPGFDLSSDGEIEWTPAVNGLHAVQIVVRSARGATIPLDVLFNVQDFAAGVPPVLEIDGSTAPGDFLLQAGETLTFSITGSDADTDPVTGLPSVVTLSSGALPSGATLLPSMPVSGRSPLDSSFSWTPTALQGGSHVIAFTVTDDTGRQTLGSATVRVNQAPLINCGAPFSVEAVSPAGADAVVHVSASDPDTDALELEWSLDGSVVETDLLPGSSDPLDADLSSLFGLGSHTIDATVDDGYGGSATCTTSVEVVDTTPPAVPALPDLTLEAEGPLGATAFWITPPAHDSVSGSLAMDCQAPSGSVFPLGATSVVCTTVDGAGNGAGTSFEVLVVDTTPPVVTPPAEIVEEATGPETPLTFAVTAVDLVSGEVPVICVPASGSGFTVGSQLVSCSALDAAGNSGFGAFSVTVVDTTPPVIAGVPLDQLLEATSAAGAEASFDLPAASDLVDGDVPVTCSHASGDTFPLGVTVVSCAAADSHGNTSYATFTVEVQDTTAPELSVPDDVTAANCQGRELVQIGQATATDAVLLPTVTGEVTSTNGIVLSPPVPILGAEVSLGVGVHVVSWTATDGINTAQGTQTIVIGTSIQARESFLVSDRARVLNAGGGFGWVFNSGAGQTRIGNDARSGGVLSVGSVNILARAIVDGDVTSAGNVTRASGSEVRGVITQGGSVVLPGLPTLPAFPAPSLGSFTVNSGTQIRAPGSYLDATVNGGTLVLGSGDYYFRSLAINSAVTVRATANTRVFVQNSLALRSPVRAPAGSAVQPITLGFAGANLVAEAVFNGTLVAPNAHVSFGTGSGLTFTGSFFGRVLEVRPASTLICRDGSALTRP